MATSQIGIDPAMLTRSLRCVPNATDSDLMLDADLRAAGPFVSFVENDGMVDMYRYDGE